MGKEPSDNPLMPWDGKDSEEESPIFEDYSFVGFNAVIAGNIRVGYKAYVLAGSVITKDVPDFHIAYGVNEVIHFSKWRGIKLRQSEFFSK